MYHLDGINSGVIIYCSSTVQKELFSENSHYRVSNQKEKHWDLAKSKVKWN